MSLFQRLKALLLADYPVLIAWLANAGAALVLAFFFHLSTDQLGAVTMITTALVTIYSAVTARPVALSVLLGAIGTILTAVGAFGLHIDPATLSAIVSVVGTVLGLLLHQSTDSVIALKVRKLQELKAGPDGVYRSAEAAGR